MHFRVPKPLHGWREFAGEVGIIVVGVLIALGAEQIVEEVRDAGLRQEARDTIGEEISQNLDAFRRRGEIQGCIDRRLVELEPLIVDPAHAARLPRPLWVGRPQVWNVTQSRWEAATSGARTALLAPREQARFGDVYDGFRVFEAAQTVEQLAWARLRTLETLPRVDDASRWALVAALHEARYANFRIKVAMAQTRELAEAAGLRTGRLPYGEGSRSICIALATSRTDAMKQTMPGRTPIAEP